MCARAAILAAIYLTANCRVADNNRLFSVPGKSPRLNQFRLSIASNGTLVAEVFCMRRAFAFSLSLLALVSLVSSDAVAASSKKSLATITGSVRDNRGNAIAGALVSVVREGVNTVKEARTDKQGNFTAKVSPGDMESRPLHLDSARSSSPAST